MTYAVTLRPAARRALEHELPDAIAAAVIAFLAGDLADNPQRVGKPLRGKYAGLHTARRGAYRIIYRIETAEVVVNVIRIVHRADAYR